MQIVVNNITKYALVENLARIAKLICRFALTKELYLYSKSKTVKEVVLAMVKLYARTLVFLSTAKQCLE